MNMRNKISKLCQVRWSANNYHYNYHYNCVKSNEIK